MKINNQDLRRIYQSYVEARTAESRTACPSLEAMIESFDPAAPRNLKEEIIAHLSSCSSCAQEFDFIRQSLDHERQLTEKLRDIHRQPRFLSSFRSRHIWRYASFFLIAAVIISASLIFRSVWRSAGIQRGQTSPLKLIRPLGKAESSASLIFEWTALPGSTRYLIEIYDESLRPVWTSPQVDMNRLVLPSLIRLKLAAHTSYYWMVTASGPHGKSGESALRSFSLAD